jgi:hypothetical protein
MTPLLLLLLLLVSWFLLRKARTCLQNASETADAVSFK